MVGKNVKLYDMVLQFLRTLFLRTRNVHYCTLRAELLMSLHDLDVGDICSVDPCHKVAPPGLPQAAGSPGAASPLRMLAGSCYLGSAQPPGPAPPAHPAGDGLGEASTQPRSPPTCSINQSPSSRAGPAASPGPCPRLLRASGPLLPGALGPLSGDHRALAFCTALVPSTGALQPGWHRAP